MIEAGKVRAAITAAALVALLSACGSDDKESTTTTSSTSTSTSSTTASTTTTTSPVVTANSRLTLNGLGGLKVGVPVAEAEKAAGVTIKESFAGGDSDLCMYGEVTGGPAGVSVLTEHHIITRVDISEGSPVATLSGIKVGATEAEVKAAYPTIVDSAHHYVEGGHYMTYTSKTDPNLLLLFETDGKKVTEMRSGRADVVNYVEGCA